MAIIKSVLMTSETENYRLIKLVRDSVIVEVEGKLEICMQRAEVLLRENPSYCLLLKKTVTSQELIYLS